MKWQHVLYKTKITQNIDCNSKSLSNVKRSGNIALKILFVIKNLLFYGNLSLQDNVVLSIFSSSVTYTTRVSNPWKFSSCFVNFTNQSFKLTTLAWLLKSRE